MRKFILFIWLFLAHSSTSEALHLRERLSNGEEGEYIVTFQNKTYTLLRIAERGHDYLEVEEITLPGHFHDPKSDWKGWMADLAPHHTARVMYRVEIPTGRILAYYSFNEHAWLSIDPNENLFTQLIGVELEEVPSDERRRRGPPPTDGSADTRAFWEPPLFVDGKRQDDAHFSAWKGRWPKDGSELSNKRILVYLPEGEGSFLSSFPYWLEIHGGAARAHFRVVDSGKGMTSLLPKPKRRMVW